MQTRATRTGIPATSAYSLGVRSIFSIGIAGCFVLEAMGLYSLISRVELGTLVPLLAGLGLGIALADLLTATVHWACDRFGSEKTPWLGAGLIRGFRDHHREPAAMLGHDWIEVNGQAASAGFLGLVAFDLFFASDVPSQIAFAASGAQVLSTAAILSLVAVSALTNQLHYWAHATEVPVLVKRLQRAGLILSPREHARHHRAPHLHGYCIATGWLNRPLDAIQFWRRLESCLTALSGIEPHRDVDRIR